MKKIILALLIICFIFSNKAKAEGEEIVSFVYCSSVLIGLNVGTSIANMNYIKEQNMRLKPLQISGIITGTTQTLLGVVCILSLDPEYIVLGSINAGFGLAATIISIASLNKNNHLLQLNKTTAWNINPIPLRNGVVGVGVSLKHNF